MHNLTRKNKIVLLGIVLFITLLFSGGILVSFSIKDDGKIDSQKIYDDKVIVKESIEVNCGDNVPSINDFIDEKSIDGIMNVYFEGEEYEHETLDTIGTYEVKIIIKDIVYDSKIIVIDNEEPILELKEVSITPTEIYDINSFVARCEDNNKKDCILSFESEDMGNYKEEGTYEIVIIAKDEIGNEVKKKTNLNIMSEAKNSQQDNKNNVNNSSTSNSNVNNSDKNNNSVNNQSKIETTIAYKYGVKITTTGSKVVYDRTTFNATTNDLKVEATQQKVNEALNINQILIETNKYRSELGLSPLVLDDTLTIAANIRALEMTWGDELSHTRPDGRICFTIFDDIGYMSFYSGENIAWGQKNGTSAATWWRNSPGHYANMVNANYTKIGIGVYKFDGRYYYVQLFSS